MRPRRRADCACARFGCPGSSTAPTVAGTVTQPVLPGKRAVRSDCLSGEFLGLGHEAASSPERNPRSSPLDIGPAGRKIRRQSGTPASPSPEANKAKAALHRRSRSLKGRGAIRRRPRTQGRVSPLGVPRRQIVFLIRTVKHRRHDWRDGDQTLSYIAWAGCAYEIGALAGSLKLTSSQARWLASNSRSSLLFNS